MREPKFIWIALIPIVLAACNPPVSFNEPQPVGKKNLSSFPRSLHGKYESLDDQAALMISDQIIEKSYDFDYKVHFEQLDSTYRLIGDTLENLKSKVKEPIKRVGDTVIIHIHEHDTLFEINEDHIVRKFKGYYFLSSRHYDESWVIRKLELSKRRLSISSISSEEEIDKLKELTDTEQDSVPPYKFSTTKKQFKSFIKKDGFSDSEEYIKQM